MYIYDSTWLNSSQNEKCFTQICRENQNTHLCSVTPPPPKIVPFMRKCEKYSTARRKAIGNNTEHAHCMLYNKGYIKKLRICNTAFPRQQ
jgi:hypothetical protein